MVCIGTYLRKLVGNLNEIVSFIHRVDETYILHDENLSYQVLTSVIFKKLKLKTYLNNY